MKLDGQVVVIMGSGRGIGRAIALAYAGEGAKLALAAQRIRVARGCQRRLGAGS